ncbi:MAG: hypothetical protein AB7V22_01965 [Kiritimatiellia bacterium]
MSTRAYRTKVAAAVAVGLAVIAAATGLAARVLPPPANCVEAARNPYRFRDWPAYVDGLRAADGAACVVLISDSQAYGGEYPARNGYPARLEALLNERQAGGIDRWEVLNLSIDGVTTMEYMALAARLREERPLWLISVSGSADYRAENIEKGFAFPRTDLVHLFTEARLARRLPLSFWRRHGKVEDTLTAAVAQRFPLLRARDYLWSWLDTRFPGAQKSFYAPRTTYRFWQLPGKARTKPIPDPIRDPTKGRLDLTYDGRSTVLLAEFVAQLAQIPAVHKLVATAPLKGDFADAPEGAWIAAFRRDLAQLAAEHGLPFRDLTTALPPDDFITSNHFHDRNHRRLAELLADHVAAETGR